MLRQCEVKAGAQLNYSDNTQTRTPHTDSQTSSTQKKKPEILDMDINHETSLC